MTDELADLLGRAERLEQENASLRSMQSPGGDDLALRCENALLHQELRRLGESGRTPSAEAGTRQASRSSDAPQPAGDQAPRTPAEFNALSPAQRAQLARTMTPGQRDELLGRNRLAGEQDYL